MKKVLGVILIILGVILGLYVGGWILFIGSVLNIIDLIADYVSTSTISMLSLIFNIFKIMVAGFTGYVSSLILIVPGINLFLQEEQ